MSELHNTWRQALLPVLPSGIKEERFDPNKELRIFFRDITKSMDNQKIYQPIDSVSPKILDLRMYVEDHYFVGKTTYDIPTRLRTTYSTRNNGDLDFYSWNSIQVAREEITVQNGQKNKRLLPSDLVYSDPLGFDVLCKARIGFFMFGTHLYPLEKVWVKHNPCVTYYTTEFEPDNDGASIEEQVNNFIRYAPLCGFVQDVATTHSSMWEIFFSNQHKVLLKKFGRFSLL